MKIPRLLSFSLAMVMVVSLTLAFCSDLALADDASYIVQNGDNLTGIAARYGYTVQALAQANGIANVNSIYVGQVLKLPSVKNTNAPATTGEQAYLVQAGDTLTSIAARYGISIYDLAAANHLSVMSFIYTGQNLRIPQSSLKPVATTTVVATTTTAAPTDTPTPQVTTPATTPQTSRAYTIQHGDTLSNIAAKFNVTVDAIVQANHLSDPSLIISGQVLIIPGEADPNAPVAATTVLVSAPNPTPTVTVQPLGQGKWIDVDLTKEKLVAYEDTTPVFNSLVSIGVAAHPTVVGTFNIYVKYTSQAMSGPGYYLPGVPYVMYFYSAYALHGTYWHNNFGHPMSHGCVNLPTPAAKWLFNWATVGTPVHIHY